MEDTALRTSLSIHTHISSSVASCNYVRVGILVDNDRFLIFLFSSFGEIPLYMFEIRRIPENRHTYLLICLSRDLVLEEWSFRSILCLSPHIRTKKKKALLKNY